VAVAVAVSAVAVVLVAIAHRLALQAVELVLNLF
jgi:hypothetical protein